MKLSAVFVLALTSISAWAQNSTTLKEVDGVYSHAHELYLDIHQNPELSGHETQTATKLAGRLRSLGYEVTEHVGRIGIVALLKNGPGPTVMLRTELDALPVEEKTGLPYASTVHTKGSRHNPSPRAMPRARPAPFRQTRAIMLPPLAPAPYRPFLL